MIYFLVQIFEGKKTAKGGEKVVDYFASVADRMVDYYLPACSLARGSRGWLLGFG